MSIQSTHIVSSSNTHNEQKTQQTKSTNSSFNDALHQTTEHQEKIQSQENTQKLVDDLLSMISTGLTVSELEMLQELLAQLNKLKGKSDNADNDQEIKAMLSVLEAAVLEIKKRLSGEVIINQSEDEKSTNETSIESRIDSITEAINDITNGSTQENKLLEDLMNKANPSLLKNIDSIKYRVDKSEYITDEEFNNLVEKLQLQDISKDDMRLFKSIIEDQYITNSEVKDLSYEQIETLGKFIFVEDGSDGYIDKTTMNADLKAGTLLSIPIISNDVIFNKSVFEMVEGMDNDKEIQQFMHPITGTYHSSKLIAFPELQSNHYNGKDMGKVLDDLISNYKTSLDNSTRANDHEYYQNKVAQFTNLLNLYNKNAQNGEAIIENKYLLDIQFDLVEDLLSMIRTGFTVSEMESLEKMIAEINQLINDSKEKKVSEEKIKDMIKKLENEISKLQDRLNTNITVNTSEQTEESDTENLTNIMKDFKSIVKSLEDTLTKIVEESGKLIQTVNTDDELRLREQFKK